MKRSLSLMGVALSAALFCASGTAHAHIKLLKPTSWLKADPAGKATEKGAPCGPGGFDGIYQDPTPSGAVTTFRAGEEITVEWAETIPHPGYFRIALAEDRADLKDPTVPFTDMAKCNVDHSKVPTGAHDNVLADGIMLTDNPNSRPSFPNYSYKVTLPSKPCEKCTLQVIQFMENHAPGCIYYHCADIKIVAGGGDAGTSSDAGTADAGTTPAGQMDAGTVAADAGSTISMPGSGAGAGRADSGAAAGGATGTVGGTTTPGGGTTGGATSTPSAGGATAGGAPNSGDGGVAQAPAEGDDDDGGCSLALGRPRSSGDVALISLLLGLTFAIRRQKRGKSADAKRADA